MPRNRKDRKEYRFSVPCPYEGCTKVINGRSVFTKHMQGYELNQHPDGAMLSKPCPCYQNRVTMYCEEGIIKACINKQSVSKLSRLIGEEILKREENNI
jgi:hypothetical protein